jgi:hypothetical protein
MTLILHRINEDDHIQINIEILKFIKLKFKIPYIDIFLGKGLKPGLKIREELDTKNDREITGNKVVLGFQELKRQFRKFRIMASIYKSVFNYIVSKIKLDYIRFHTRIGLGDAAYTAVAVGAVYAVISYIFGHVSWSVKTSSYDIKAVPVIRRTGHPSGHFEAPVSKMVWQS